MYTHTNAHMYILLSQWKIQYIHFFMIYDSLCNFLFVFQWFDNINGCFQEEFYTKKYMKFGKYAQSKLGA